MVRIASGDESNSRREDIVVAADLFRGRFPLRFVLPPILVKEGLVGELLFALVQTSMADFQRFLVFEIFELISPDTDGLILEIVVLAKDLD